MKPRTIRKLYQEVSGLERFRLVVAADLRGDRLERDHLLKEARNPQFRLALGNAQALTRSYVAACGPSLGQLELLDRLREPVAAALSALVPGVKPVPVSMPSRPTGASFPLDWQVKRQDASPST